MTYAAQVVETIHRYKRKHGKDNLVLVPILDADQNTIGVELLRRWRAENTTLSPTQFQVTYAGTERWIENLVVQNDQRILFMVQDVNGTCIGHMGFADFCYDTRSAKIDLVVRGEKNISRGLMGHAIAALVRWGKQELELEHIGLDVLWDNEHAIAFYERCGFHKCERIPLTRKESEGEIRWVPHKGAQFEAEKYCQHMVLC